MPKFDADSIGGDIEYDFSRWGGPKGVVPEPSRGAFKKFMKDAQAVYKSLRPQEDKKEETEDKEMSPNELIEAVNDIDSEEMFEKLSDGLTDCMAELCGGSPDKEALAALHYRPFMGFFGYLVENMTNPEVSTRGSKPSPVRLRSV